MFKSCTILPFLKRAIYSLSLSLAILCQGQSSHADVIILDNTTSSSALTTNNQLNATPQTRYAAVFTSQANAILNKMTIVPLYTLGGPTSADYTVHLYSVDGSNKPTGTALASSTISGVSLLKGRSTATKADAVELDLTTNSTGSWSLASGTNYAVALSSNNNVGAWAILSDSPTTANGTYLGRALSGDGGINWNAPMASGTPYIKLSAIPGGAASVPEPSTCLLCGLATGVASLVSRKRKKKPAR